MSTLVRRAAMAVALACTLLTVACGGAAGGSGGAAAEGGESAAGEPAIAVSVGTVAREPIASLYSTSATLRADRSATVIARTRGVVERLVVEEGDRVAAGQPLAYLEDDEQTIAAARARTTEETARREHERAGGLYERGLLSVDEYEAGRRDAEDAQHALELAELELSRTVIRAPIAGTVVARHLDVGATVSDGTPVYDLADVDPLYADINIPERHVTRLHPGQTVLLAADATDAEASAVIERIAPAVDPATGTVKVTVAVQGDSRLRPGAFVRVDIVTDTHDDALVVARSALVAEGRRWHLYRLAEDGRTVEQIEVALGFESGDRVEILAAVDPETSIAAGDRVVVVGAPALSEGAVVRVMNDEGSGAEAG
ncbi:MAG TPA: efflux RND transporter periplasmic adaptor subunit [Chondromyces sp.]|nr:efflux RND transporter periplasmic adaptor subunit [Chondromyces sp.]